MTEIGKLGVVHHDFIAQLKETYGVEVEQLKFSNKAFIETLAHVSEQYPWLPKTIKEAKEQLRGDRKLDWGSRGNLYVRWAAAATGKQDITFERLQCECLSRNFITEGDLLVGAAATGSYFDGRTNIEGASTLPVLCLKGSGNAGQAASYVWKTETSGDNRFFEFGTEGTFTSRGFIDYNRGSNVTRYSTTSDGTLKNIIGDSDGQKSLEILNSTRIREYAWKDDPTQKPQIGVIAQELYETFKGAVSVGGDLEQADEEGNVTTKYSPWGVDKTAFTFHLVAGWQAHEKIIKQQADMIAALEARLTALENK